MNDNHITRRRTTSTLPGNLLALGIIVSAFAFLGTFAWGFLEVTGIGDGISKLFAHLMANSGSSASMAAPALNIA